MYKTTKQGAIFSISLFLIGLNLLAQNSDITEVYADYTEAPREVAYVHLNKSTYIEGEILGFKAYIFDKVTKEPSKMTANLYCTISDEQGEVIKKKLIKVNNGVSSNVFDVDSIMSTGIFTFKAYTNWMKNFDEQNHFEQTFKVIDADNLGEVKPVLPKDIEIDLQALGEGGHLLYNVSNNVGVIAKNQFGNGIANAFGNIKDSEGNIVSEFKLNDVGLAKALFTPMSNQSYTVNLNLNDRTISKVIDDIKPFGVVMNLISSKEKVSLMIKTNAQTLKTLNNKLQIALHNGGEMVLSPFKLNEDGVAVISYPTNELFSGINMFTVFDANSKPILERLYFNNTISQQKVSKVFYKSKQDSLAISLQFDKANLSKWSNLSVSILPSETKSYNHHNTILSQLYIQPYVKGNIEKGLKYFNTQSRENDYNLDLLMLTQGWSSYNWNSIFSTKDKKYIYPFERGIDIVANVNKGKKGSYLVYPLAGNSTQLFDVPNSEKEFTIKELFPTKDDILRIGYLDTSKKEFKEKPSLYLQYYPSKFSDFNGAFNVIEQAYTINETSINPKQESKAWDNSTITKLDEIVVKGSKRLAKIEALAEKATLAKYAIIDDKTKLRGMRLDLYIQRLGYVTQFDYFSGTLSITNPRVNWGTNVPLIYLDDALLTTLGSESDFSLLTFLTTNDIDYIEYEQYGVGGGMRGGAGYIKIYSGPRYQDLYGSNHTTSYDVPLRFSEHKSFYTPKYQYYNTDFFKEYGTIGWEPKLEIDKDGLATMSIYDTKTSSISVFVEGIINDNEFISQEIKIEREN